jgi:Protein of unknown function (DUF3800)
MVTLYFDDSGTHPQSDVAIAAAYVSSVEQWVSFQKDWNYARHQDGFNVFHTADFMAKQGEFSAPEWQDEDKCRQTIERLIGLINIRVRHLFICGVLRKPYDTFIAPDPKLAKLCGRNHYVFAVKHCLNFIKEWKAEWASKENVKYIFDRVPKGSGIKKEINEVFNEFVNDPSNPFGIEAGGYGFENKAEVTPLQAADILAWHAYDHMVRSELGDRQFLRTMELLMSKPRTDRYLDSDGLKAFRAKLVEEDYYKNLTLP